jgi:hypothetical protein
MFAVRTLLSTANPSGSPRTTSAACSPPSSSAPASHCTSPPRCSATSASTPPAATPPCSPEHLIAAHEALVERRRKLRHSAEQRTATGDEWAEFEQHFLLRKVALGDCHRPLRHPLRA